MASKAEEIIERFSKDPALKKEILTLVAEVKSGKHPQDVDKTIARFTKDPVLTKKIKEIISKVKAGHSVEAIAGYFHPNPAKARRAADKIHEHRAVVHHIVGKH